MTDNPRLRGKPDRDRVSQQKHEVDYLANKFELPKPLIQKVIDQEGPMRKDVETYLAQMKRNRKS